MFPIMLGSVAKYFIKYNKFEFIFQLNLNKKLIGITIVSCFSGCYIYNFNRLLMDTRNIQKKTLTKYKYWTI